MASSELLEIVGPAFVAGLMIALTHAPLGLEVLKRGIIFIDLAIAQVAGFGVILAQMAWEEPAWWAVQLAALCSALLAALLFRWVEKTLPDEQEAIIGTCFVLVASLALLLLSSNPHGGEEIEHLLSGQILFVTWHEVLLHAPIYTAILIAWFAKPQMRTNTWFYVLFATAITSSVQLVGVYVVFASLILPAIAARSFLQKQKVAWLCGIGSVMLGILASVQWDAPAGPLLVVTYALVTLGVRLRFRFLTSKSL